jgi:hypothetical protein
MRIRRLIEREHAAAYIFTMMISFAAAVLATRIFLELTGYPQIGGSQLHIAHVVWGGLIVAAGAALPLLFSNRFVLGISATLSGIGLGLFFDEVGKFLTQDNNYFFRPAAAIVYILFLIGIYIYITVRRGEPDAQTRLHHALVALQEIVDGDLDVREKAELEELLSGIIGDAQVPDMRELAEELLEFVREEADTIPASSSRLVRWFWSATGWMETHALTRTNTRWLLIISTALLGIFSLLDFAALARALNNPQQMEVLLQAWVARGNLTSLQESIWFAVMIGLKGIVGFSLIIALVMFLLGHERRGVGFALAGLLLSVTALDVLLFYFQQFLAAMYATIDFAMIVALNFYANRYVQPPQGASARAKKSRT